MANFLCPHHAMDHPGFRDWFGSSQAVDGRGLPLLLFHGTEQPFDAFDPTHIARRSSRPAFWFASHQASGFYGPRRVAVYLRAPRVLDAPDDRLTHWVQHALDANLLADLNESDGPTWDAVRFRDVIDGDTPSDVWAVFAPNAIKSPAATLFDGDEDSIFT